MACDLGEAVEMVAGCGGIGADRKRYPGGWTVAALHRTLIQTGEDPGPAPLALARLLAQLDTISAAGFISTTGEEPATPAVGTEEDHITDRADGVRFRFIPFPDPPPGHHTGAEYA